MPTKGQSSASACENLDTFNGPQLQVQPKILRFIQARAANTQAAMSKINTTADESIEYDAIVIGSGMGGLATAAQMVAKGAKVLVLEK